MARTTPTSPSPSLRSRLMQIQTNLNTFIKPRAKRIAVGLLTIFAIVLIAALAARPKSAPPAPEPEPAPIAVKTYTLGSSQLSETVTGTVKNLSTVTLVAQAPGPVSQISAVEGDQVTAGKWIVYQSSAYAAGNAPAVSRQIAEKNAQLAEDTLKNTVETVSKQREIADRNRDNATELRKITNDGLSATRSLIDTTKLVITKLETDIAATVDESVKLALRQQLVSYQNILGSAESGLRSAEYSASGDKPPAQLASASRDLVYQTTEVQLKAAQIQKDIADLSVKAARIQESTMRVAAPFSGTIERILVQKGQYVTPGTPVAILRGAPKLCLVIPVSGTLASRIDQQKYMTTLVGGKELTLPINHVSQTGTAGQLYEVLTLIPATQADSIIEGQTVTVSLPLESQTSQTQSQIVPLDSVYVTNTSRYVLVLENGLATRKAVTTGTITGDNIEITAGLSQSDELILDRSIREGQRVTKES